MTVARERPRAASATALRGLAFVALIGAAVFALRGGLPGGAEAANDGDAPVAAVPVSYAPASVHRIEETEHSVATVRARRTPRVAAEVEGTLVEVLVEEGDAVARNDLLAVLDDTNHLIEYRRSEAEVRRIGILVAQQETELERHRRLVRDGHMPQLTAEEVEANLAVLREELAVAKWDFERAERNLARTRILAPYEAVIAERHVSEGDYVGTGDALFDLTGNGTLQARVPLPETVADRLEKGQEVRLWRGSRERGVTTGAIGRIAPRVDDDSRSVTAIVELSEVPGSWRSGTSVDAEVVIDRREAILLPPESVVRRPSGTVAYVLEDGRIARERAVTTGLRSRHWVEITEGIAPGEAVVMDGAGFLIEGAPVEARPRDWEGEISATAPVVSMGN